MYLISLLICLSAIFLAIAYFIFPSTHQHEASIISPSEWVIVRADPYDWTKEAGPAYKDASFREYQAVLVNQKDIDLTFQHSSASIYFVDVDGAFKVGDHIQMRALNIDLGKE